MKTTLRWLGEFADIPDDSDRVVEALESLGHEVEGMEHVGLQFSGVVVARAEELMPHPDADRIQLVRVTAGGEERTVVCGAWNFEAGDVVAYAPPGALLAGGIEVETRSIRGVESPGMICSERELGLGEDHEGILVLDPSTPLGTKVEGLLGLPDVVFDIKITTNRPDAMGVVGLARDLAAYFEVPLVVPGVEVPVSGEPSEAKIIIEDPAGCHRFTAREVRRVTVAPSPLWMRQRLAATGIRPINNVVDISNYVMLEYGHPTHTFDMDRLGDTVVVRRAAPGETLRTLDGSDHDLLPDDLLIADGQSPVGFAGLMGGEETEVRDGTTRVLIEVAYFDPASVMLTSKRHGLRSEASARFERGMDPEQPQKSNDRVAELLAAHAGGRPVPNLIDVYPKRAEPTVLEFDPAAVSRVLGYPLSPGQTADYLERLGFGVDGTDAFLVTVPTRRPDVERSVDLLEEVARLHGYDQVPETIARGPGGGLPVSERRHRMLRRAMVGAGYSENLAFSFMDPTDLDRMLIPQDDPRRRTLAISNPVSEEASVLRTTLLPGLLHAAAVNFGYGLRRLGLFETGKVFWAGAGELPEQPETLAFVRTGPATDQWHGPDKETDALDAVGTWALVAEVMEAKGHEIRQAEVAGMHPGRSGELVADGAVIGAIGELHPKAAAAFGLSGRVAVAEISIDPLLIDPGLWQFSPPSQFPPLRFDLAFELDISLAGSRLLEVVKDSGAPLIETVDVFDVFRGDPLPEGRKSIALRIGLRATDRTLTDDEAATVRADIVSAVEEELGGSLRGEA